MKGRVQSRSDSSLCSKFSLKISLETLSYSNDGFTLDTKRQHLGIKVLYYSFQVPSHACGPGLDYLDLFSKILRKFGSSK